MSRVPISVELRFLRIPTRWSVNEESLLMPEVDQNPERKLRPLLDDPRDLRTRFLKLPHNAESARKFLEDIGVWTAWKVKTISSAGWRTGTTLREMLLDGAFGYRYLSDLAVLPLGMKELWDEQAYWKNVLLKNLAPLRHIFAAPPNDRASAAEKESFAVSTEFLNTLPMHLEWKSGPAQYPRAFIQPLTGRELLMATAWLDIVQQEKVQVCQRRDCGQPFTGREQKYCCDSCAHLMAVRAFRERQKDSGTRRRKKRRAPKLLALGGNTP